MTGEDGKLDENRFPVTQIHETGNVLVFISRAKRIVCSRQ